MRTYDFWMEIKKGGIDQNQAFFMEKYFSKSLLELICQDKELTYSEDFFDIKRPFVVVNNGMTDSGAYPNDNKSYLFVSIPDDYIERISSFISKLNAESGLQQDIKAIAHEYSDIRSELEAENFKNITKNRDNDYIYKDLIKTPDNQTFRERLLGGDISLLDELNEAGSFESYSHLIENIRSSLFKVYGVVGNVFPELKDSCDEIRMNIFGVDISDDKGYKQLLKAFRSEIGELKSKIDEINNKMDKAIAKYEVIFSSEKQNSYDMSDIQTQDVIAASQPDKSKEEFVIKEESGNMPEYNYNESGDEPQNNISVDPDDYVCRFAENIYQCFTYGNIGLSAENRENDIMKIAESLQNNPGNAKEYVETLTNIQHTGNLTNEQHNYIDEVALSLMAYFNGALPNKSEVSEVKEDTSLYNNTSSSSETFNQFPEGVYSFNAASYFMAWLDKLDENKLDKRIVSELSSIESIIDEFTQSTAYKIVYNNNGELGLYSTNNGDIKYYTKGNKIAMSKFLVDFNNIAGNSFNQEQIRQCYDKIMALESEDKKRSKAL